MTAEPAALRLVGDALGFVLGVDPARLRADTPLADIGADSVAIIAAMDIVEDRLAGLASGVVDDHRVRVARTVNDLAEAVPRAQFGAAT